jgi:cell fate (sporulation/competence/biofilm development) regulator YmcA (YheA/YmcA/DUF963 family)
MAGKKGQLHQVMFVMVDATDFATTESGVAAANCTAKFFGVNHNASAAMTSGAVSKALSLVRSGILRATLKTTENNYDFMMLKVTESAVGCAPQVLTWENEAVDLSDVHSLLTLVASNVSDVESQLDLVPVVDHSSRLSDILSLLSDLDSNLQSRVPKAVATASGLTAAQTAITDAISDVESQLDLVPIVDHSSRLSDIYSLLSDLDSNVQSRVPKEVASKSLLSDVNSDLGSKIGAVSVALTASDISDIASAVAASVGAAVADAVWDELLEDHLGAGSAGQILKGDNRVNYEAPTKAWSDSATPTATLYTGTFEPSGIVWHPRIAKWFWVGDNGQLCVMDEDGSNLKWATSRTTWRRSATPIRPQTISTYWRRVSGASSRSTSHW